MPAPTRRRAFAVLAALAVAVGLLASRLPDPLGDIAGTVLYAVLAYLLVGVAGTAARPRRIAAVALAICWAVELLQLTPLPRTLAEQVPVVAYVLGTTFNPLDLLGYAVGVAAACSVDLAVARRRPVHPPL